MKEDTYRIARVADAIYSGRVELGHSVENDAGGFDAFDSSDKPLGTFATRGEARNAIVRAADHPPSQGGSNVSSPVS
jgi:hypothetical protein